MIWLTYYLDWSGMAVFTDEVKALRYAVKNGMAVVDVRPGQQFGPGQDPMADAGGQLEEERDG